MVDPSRLQWDHVRVFLAAMRASSMRQAAADVGISRPTAARHLARLEDEIRLPLFERRPDGLHATSAAQRLLPIAEEVERGILAFVRVADAADTELRGPIHLSMPEFLGSDLLMPAFAEFLRRWPHTELFVHATYAVARLDRREADVAVRIFPHGKRPADNVAGRLATTLSVAVYGDGDAWVGQAAQAAEVAAMQQREWPDLPVRGGQYGVALLRAACVAGLGYAVLPCFYAEPMLEPRSRALPGWDVWVLVHPDLRRNPRLRAFRDAVVEALAAARVTS